jgi:hypothetical protein
MFVEFKFILFLIVNNLDSYWFFKNSEDYNHEPYSCSRYLKKRRGMNNPACVNLLLQELDLDKMSKSFSLMTGLNGYL